MPRFELSSRFELSAALTALGMGVAFTDGSDFSRMFAAPMMLSAVFHEAFVRVDEEGTEAAAGTVVVVVSPPGAPVPPPPAVMVLDRPFIFAIYDEPTGQILFLGRVMDPSAR
jgi:serpin B